MEDRKRKMDDGAGGIIETAIKFPVWFDPIASGGTPMREALTRAAEELVTWCDSHPDCYLQPSWRYQKQPCTKMHNLYIGKTISGLPCNLI